jgi:hypothetical protein
VKYSILPVGFDSVVIYVPGLSHNGSSGIFIMKWVIKGKEAAEGGDLKGLKNKPARRSYVIAVV